MNVKPGRRAGRAYLLWLALVAVAVPVAMYGTALACTHWAARPRNPHSRLVWLRAAYHAWPGPHQAERYAFAQYLDGQKVEAAERLQGLLSRRDELSGRGYYFLLLYHLTDKSVAVQRLEGQALAQHPESWQLWYIAGYRSGLAFHFKTAAERLDKAFTLLPKELPLTVIGRDLLVQRCRVYVHMRSFAEAVSRADEGLTMVPQSADLHEWKAVALEGLDQYARAAEEWQQALRLPGVHDFDMLYQTCLCMERAGQYEKALRLAKLRKQETRSQTYYLSLAASYATRQPLLARQALWQALQNTGKGWPMAEYIGMMWDASEAWTGRPEVARRVLRETTYKNDTVRTYRLLLLYQLETGRARQRLGEEIRSRYEEIAFNAPAFVYLDVRDVLDGKVLRMPRSFGIPTGGWRV